MNNPVAEILRRVPGINANQVYDGENDGIWYVKFSIDIKSKYAWNLVQEFGWFFNSITLTERLATKFYPDSPPPYLNGGPQDFLMWIIEATSIDVDSNKIAEAFIHVMPKPIHEFKKWDELIESQTIPDVDNTKYNLEVYAPKDAWKDKDCESVGKLHKWYNCDDVHSGCYNCGKIVLGQLWKR